MTNEEILQKAIEKAINNGWESGDFWLQDNITVLEIKYAMFSHDFAKAFWGERIEYCDACHKQHFGNMSDCDCGIGDNQESWKFHLQQMVLEEKPIKYLEKFL